MRYSESRVSAAESDSTGSARVRIMGSLGRLADGGRVEAEQVSTPTKLREVIASIEKKYQIELSRASMLVLVNGVEANALDDLETQISADDEIVLLPMFHGG